MENKLRGIKTWLNISNSYNSLIFFTNGLNIQKSFISCWGLLMRESSVKGNGREVGWFSLENLSPYCTIFLTRMLIFSLFLLMPSLGYLQDELLYNSSKKILSYNDIIPCHQGTPLLCLYTRMMTQVLLLWDPQGKGCVLHCVKSLGVTCTEIIWLPHVNVFSFYVYLQKVSNLNRLILQS